MRQKIHELPADCLLAFTRDTTLRGLDGRAFEFPAAEIFRAMLVGVIPEGPDQPVCLYEFQMWVDDGAVGMDHKTFMIRQDHVELAVIPPPVGPKGDVGIPLPGWTYPLVRLY